MKASETRLIKIIDGTNQYVVPHFQRPYTWQKKNWEILWKDIEALLYDNGDIITPSDHFMGAIVTAPEHSAPEGVIKYLIIDGQQRLTTLLLVLAAIRDRAKQLDDTTLANRIHELYLTNRYQIGLDQYKLLPTQGDEKNHNDRDEFIKIINNDSSLSEDNALHNAYKYFAYLIRAFSDEILNSLSKAILSRIFLVSIVLERDDNHYAIFESLNAKGQPLSQSDLVRNFFFMNIDATRHDSIYKDKWIPMERSIKRENMELYLKHFLIKDGVMVKESDVYYTIKKKIEGKGRDHAEKLLDDLVNYSRYYVKFIDVDQEKSIHVRERLIRLQRLRATVCYPFLLNIFNDRSLNKIGEEEFIDILDVIENFIVRRYVCGTIRAELNEMFTALYKQISKFPKKLDGIREILGTRNYPLDEDFCESLQMRKLYSIGGDIRDRAKLILERIETHRGGKEPVKMDNLTIEHLMPQKLTNWWREHLGDTAEEIHDLYLHTIGNLTLTGYNPELSNADFFRKVEVLRQSNLVLNREIVNFTHWTRVEIEERARILAKYALDVWPNFAPKNIVRHRSSVRGATPKQLFFLDEPFECKTWQEVLRITLTQVIKVSNEEITEQLIEAFPKYLRRSPSGLRSPKTLSNDLFYEGHMNAEYINRFCTQIIQLAGISSDKWHVET